MHSAFVFGEESNVSQEVSRINGSVVPPAALIGTGIFIFSLALIRSKSVALMILKRSPRDPEILKTP